MSLIKKQTDAEKIFEYKQKLLTRKHKFNLGKVPERHRTLELCRFAVVNDANDLKYVPKEFLTQELCLIAVLANAICLRYVPKEFLTQDLCLAAIARDFWLAIGSVPESMFTPEFCQLVIVTHPKYAFEYLPSKYQTAELCEFAMLSGDLRAFSSLPSEKWTPELCETAVEICPLNITSISDPEMLKHLMPICEKTLREKEFNLTLMDHNDIVERCEYHINKILDLPFSKRIKFDNCRKMRSLSEIPIAHSL